MHKEAFDFVALRRTDEPVSVIEIGSRNINGTVRELFPNAAYVGLDLYEGQDVDVVCNATEYQPTVLADIVVCCEVLEHAKNWRLLIDAAFRWLKPAGIFIMTCAGPGRFEHSAIDGEARLLPGEHYENLSDEDVYQACIASGFSRVQAVQRGHDTYAVAIR